MLSHQANVPSGFVERERERENYKLNSSLINPSYCVALNSKAFKIFILFFLIALVFFPDTAAAAGGLSKAKHLLETVSDWLTALAVVTVTIAILVVGYKVLFGGQTIRECTPIIIGGLLIASASEIAALLMK